ncbi:hypothetical protein SUGI_0495600 [Cryptomeria japonica]|nr:hypothetical protein SUGI_0495600 [Cryptomeria japonica]
MFPGAFGVKMLVDEVTGCGKLEEAFKFFNVMSDQGLRQDGETYQIIQQESLNVLRIEVAWLYWQAAAACMDESSGLGWCSHSPTVELADSLLKKTEKRVIADKLWQKM